MKGLLAKDYLTIKKKYGVARLFMDLVIIIALMMVLEGAGTIYISFLLIPVEVTSMIISLTTCDEQWKWENTQFLCRYQKSRLYRADSYLRL